MTLAVGVRAAVGGYVKENKSALAVALTGPEVKNQPGNDPAEQKIEG